MRILIDTNVVIIVVSAMAADIDIIVSGDKDFAAVKLEKPLILTPLILYTNGLKTSKRIEMPPSPNYLHTPKPLSILTAQARIHSHLQQFSRSRQNQPPRVSLNHSPLIAQNMLSHLPQSPYLQFPCRCIFSVKGPVFLTQVISRQ